MPPIDRTVPLPHTPTQPLIEPLIEPLTPPPTTQPYPDEATWWTALFEEIDKSIEDSFLMEIAQAQLFF